MKNKSDKRLISAFEHIDDKYIESAAKRIKPRDAKVSERGANKAKIIKQVALLAACLLVLGAAVPLAGRLVGFIPEIFNPASTANESDILETNETEPPVVDEVPAEYFTNGRVFYGGGVDFGGQYEGKWIHVSDLLASNIKVMAAYDPVAGTTTSICVDPNCPSSEEVCPAIIPIGWDVRYIEIMGDWCLCQIDGNGKYNTEIRIYNMKTGDARIISEDTEAGNIITYPSVFHPMDGKAYLNLYEVDSVSGTRRGYVSVYDPETDTIEYLCDEPENMHMIGLSNKRIFFAEKRQSLRDPSVVWSTDYYGGNLKKEEVLNFDLLVMSGTYAYDTVSSLTGSSPLRAYDLATDSIFTIDFGGPVKNYIPAPDKLGFVPQGGGKIYFADARGENAKLVVEYDVADFTPFCVLGDYIIGNIPPSQSSILPGGKYSLNSITGEFKLIPGLSYP